MIRADAADLFARAHLFREWRGQISPRSTSEPSYLRLEPVLRLAVPALIGVFIAALTTTICMFLVEAHDSAIATAVNDLELVATTTSADLGRGPRRNGDHDPGEALLRSLPTHALRMASACWSATARDSRCGLSAPIAPGDGFRTVLEPLKR